MKGVKVVLFDAGNTLVHVNLDEFRRLLRRHGCPEAAERVERAELVVRHRLDTADTIAKTTDQSRWVLYYGSILDEIGAPRAILDDLRAYHERTNLWDTVRPDTPAVLKRLRRRSRLGVVSNSNGTVADVLARMGLAGHFETIVDSHVVGVEKPDPRIFEIALDRMKARPEEAVYVGDIYHVDVVGARRAGIRGILLDPGDVHGDKDCERIRTLASLESLL